MYDTSLTRRSFQLEEFLTSGAGTVPGHDDVAKLKSAVVAAETGGAADLAKAVVANANEQMDILAFDEHFKCISPKSVGEFAALKGVDADMELETLYLGLCEAVC